MNALSGMRPEKLPCPRRLAIVRAPHPDLRLRKNIAFAEIFASPTRTEVEGHESLQRAFDAFARGCFAAAASSAAHKEDRLPAA